MSPVDAKCIEYESRFAARIAALRTELETFRKDPFGEPFESVAMDAFLRVEVKPLVKGEGLGRSGDAVERHLRGVLTAGLPVQVPPPETLEAWPQEELATPVARVLRSLVEEAHPQLKFHRLIDLFEVTVKYCTSVCLAKFRMLVEKRRIADRILADLFLDSIRAPSLGHWVTYLEAFLNMGFTARRIPELVQISGVFKVVATAYQKTGKSTENLIACRNKWKGHGATETPEPERKLLEYAPEVLQVLKALMPLLRLPLIGFSREGDLVQWQGAGEGLPVAMDMPEGPGPHVLFDGEPGSLFPLLYVPHEQEIRHFIYNSFRENVLQYLAYQGGKQTGVSLEQAPVFQQLFLEAAGPELKHAVDPGARERTALLAGFRGRGPETRALLKPILDSRDRALLMVFGLPGIGKGALLARVAEDLRDRKCAALEAQDGDCEGLAEKLANWTGAVFHFPVKSEDRSAERFLRCVTQFQRHVLGLNVQPGASQAEFEQGLEQIAAGNRSVVFILDGLDEPFRNTVSGADRDTGLLSILSREVPRNCTFLLSARQLTRYTRWFQGHPDRVARVEAMTLAGLTLEDVRELAEDALGPTALIDHAGFVERLFDHACGKEADGGANPLFVSVVLEDVKSGVCRLGADMPLPPSLDAQYEAFFDHLQSIKSSTADWSGAAREALRIVYVLAAAQSAVTELTLAQVLELEIDDVQAGLGQLRQFLAESRLSTGVRAYRLFHKSLADHVQERKVEQFSLARKTLLEFCRKWELLCKRAAEELRPETNAVAEYALRFVIPHLVQVRDVQSGENTKMNDEILGLLENEAYRRAVFETCGSSDPLRLGLSEGLRILRDRGSEKATFDRFVQLLTWYYFESTTRHKEAVQNIRRSAECGDLGRILQLSGSGQSPTHCIAMLLNGLHVMGDRSRSMTTSEARIWREVEQELARWNVYEARPEVNELFALLSNRIRR